MFPDGPMLKEEAILIKERLNKDEFATFAASNGWLEKLKQTYGQRETSIIGEADDIPKMTIQSWIERLPELTSGYMETSGTWMNWVCFSKLYRKEAFLKNREDGKRMKSRNNVSQQPFL